MEDNGPFVKLESPANLQYYKMFKPRNVLSSNAPLKAFLPASYLLPEARASEVSHVGRLDYESEGLLIWTNDGTFSRLLTHPDIGVLKEYHVLVEDQNWPFRKNVFTEEILGELKTEGVDIGDG